MDCRWLDFDSNCVVSRAEYQAAYRALKASCAKLGEQREWSSFTGKRLDVLRHKRLRYEPQDTLVGGVTEAQQIGCVCAGFLSIVKLVH